MFYDLTIKLFYFLSIFSHFKAGYRFTDIATNMQPIISSHVYSQIWCDYSSILLELHMKFL